MKLEREKIILLKGLIRNISLLLVALNFVQLSISFALTKTAKAIPVDSSQTIVDRPSAERQKEIFYDKDYLFDKKGKPPVSWWDRFWDWFGRQMDEMFSTKTGTTFLLLFKWVLIIAGLGLIIFLLLKTDIRFLFYKKSKSGNIDFSEITEDIHKIDFDKQIDEAIAKKDFRKAVRLYFLKILKSLSDKNLIDWKPDKTNYDFYVELKEQNCQNDFRSVSVLYDYVWYGDFSLNENEFKTAAQQFRQFNEHLKN